MSALRDLILDALKQADHILLALCVAASAYGIVLIYSASRYKAVFHSLPIKQGISLVIGIVLYFVVSQFNIDVIRSHWKIALGFVTVLYLLLRTPLGQSYNGNRAWLGIKGFPFNLQPAEIGKIVFAMLLALLLIYWKRKKKRSSIPAILSYCVLLGYMVGLLYVVSKDAGSCCIFLFIFVAILWVGGVSKLWFAAGIGVIALAIWKIWPMIPDTNMRKMRILTVLDHDIDPQGVGFQQTKCMLAVRSGGLTGQGYLQGTLTQSAQENRLPSRYADTIFCSCCEEWGLVGAAIILLLLFAIVCRVFYVGLKAPDEFSSLMCIGYAGMFFGQILLNVGMCLYVMPVIGVTLPFFSYGGTSIMVNFVIMGLVSGVKNRREPDWLKNSDKPEPEQPQQPQPRRKSVLFTPGDRRR